MKSNKIWIGIIFLAVISILTIFPLASAQGTSFDNATQLELNKTYTLNVTKEKPVFFLLPELNPAEVFTIESTRVKRQEGPFACDVIFHYYDSNREEVSKGGYWFMAPNSIKQRIFYSAEKLPIYLKLETCDDCDCDYEVISLKFEKIILYDAGSGTDAGSNFDTALPISVGTNQKGWLSYDDVTDTYKIDLKRGDNLIVKLTPKADSNFGIEIFDQNRISKVYSEGANPGAIFSTSYVSPSNQTVYFQVFPTTYNVEERYYYLDVNITKGIVPIVCNPGEERCNSGNIEKCSGDGATWEVYKTCEDGCGYYHGEPMCNIQIGIGPTTSSGEGPWGSGSSGFLGFLAGIMVFIIIFGIAIYVYFALALMTIAKKTGTENAWFAWVPVLNYILMAKISKMELWTVILAFVPVANIIILIMWFMKIAEARGRPSWWGVIIGLVPILSIVSLVFLGLLAWKEAEGTYAGAGSSGSAMTATGQPRAMSGTTKISPEIKQIVDYINKNKEGYTKAQLRKALIDAGWPITKVNEAYDIIEGKEKGEKIKPKASSKVSPMPQAKVKTPQAKAHEKTKKAVLSALLEPPNRKLLDYIKNARASGMKDPAIRKALIDAGWPKAQVDNTFRYI